MAEDVRLRISWSAIFKLLAGCLIGYLAVKLWPIVEVLVLAVLLAITLAPLLRWAERIRWPHWAAVLLCGFVLIGSTLLVVALLLPLAISQGSALIAYLPHFKSDLLGRLPSAGPLRDSVTHFLNASTFTNPEPLLKQLAGWGGLALRGLAAFVLVLILTIYLLADGRRVYAWLLAFLRPADRQKVAGASEEIVAVVGRYMFGQLVTSLLCGAYVFTVLALLGVPNAVVLAVVAAVFDIVPLIGFFLFTIPAAGVALTVSSSTAIFVVVLYLAYHAVENYYIVPKVYGDALKLSALTVLLACLIGAAIAGPVGVVIALPVVASYPVIERWWLRPRLEPDTIAQHEQIERTGHE
jgi:predicted PurR-regulated permease PerM